MKNWYDQKIYNHISLINRFQKTYNCNLLHMQLLKVDLEVTKHNQHLWGKMQGHYKLKYGKY